MRFVSSHWLRIHEQLLTIVSSRCSFKGFSNYCYPPTYCCEGHATVNPSRFPKGEAFQRIYRGSCIYHKERRILAPIQGPRSTDYQGVPSSRSHNDAER